MTRAAVVGRVDLADHERPVVTIDPDAGSLPLDEVGGYDESWPSYEDWDVWCSMAERGMRAAVLPQIGFHYRYRDDSMVRTTAVERDRALRARLVRKHEKLAREHAADALIAHLAVAPCPDARPPKATAIDKLSRQAQTWWQRYKRGREER